MKMDLPPPGLTADDVALRGTRRDSMFMKAQVFCERINHGFEVVVRNVSSGGMLVDSKLELVNGDNVKVTLDNIGQVPGRVVWAQNGRFGVAFDVSIDPHQVRKPVKVRPAPAAGSTPRRFVSRLHGKPIIRL
ncbi:PilZ domain-containing protein [Sphingomonas lacunae]|uniref:PilZ domain-containing protein n=1 Tax=Sphingomonas lacunae TaxID=2698828 RepID=A0A6M4AT68_9SPHN|nr:PilZ domain-containing protein [Sphingomonas lacunae]QJQ31600.1 PilZ domain-containing protein [Sphingomonas lacunae]